MTSQANNPSNAYTELLMEFGRFREENQKQHGELATAISDLRGEVTTAMTDLRGEVTTAMTGLHGEVTTAMIGLRGEFTTETADIRTEMAKAETRTVRWLLGGLAYNCHHNYWKQWPLPSASCSSPLVTSLPPSPRSRESGKLALYRLHCHLHGVGRRPQFGLVIHP